MKKGGSILGYFTEGFALSNKSLEVFLYALILTLLGSINAFFPKLPLPETLPKLFSIIGRVISFGFLLSIPVFLLEKQQGKTLVFNKIFSTTLQNTKRFILPAILIFILFLILLVIITTILQPTKEQSLQFFQNIQNRRNPLFLFIFPIISSFLVFTPFLFSLEHKGLLASIRNSIILSFKNLYYITAVIAVGIISYLLTTFLPVTESWALFLSYAINLYAGLVVIASTLFYYQKIIKRETA